MPHVTIAVDAGSSLDRILPAALLLASVQNADLQCVVSQNRELLKAADLSCVYETGSRSALRHKVNSTSLRAQLSKFAESIKQRLSREAERWDIPWHIEESEDSLESLLANTTDSTIISDQSIRMAAGLRSGIRQSHPTSQTPVVVVVDDHSEAASNLLNLARRMVAAGPHNHGIEVLHTRDASQDSLRSVLRHHLPVVLLIGRHQNLVCDSRWAKELTSVRCPFAIVPSAEIRA
ncbi:MAG: hypothetical protein JNL58_05690 [Planctomyces sp.]|nr:hypothetical protein [Planctomyces sp.]